MSEVTKRALEQSLKNLLLKKPLTKITINDITEDCGINRMTFYYHFKDIYDLVEWSCLEDARKALEEKKTHDTWQEGFLNIFEAVLANKPFIMNVYRCVDREQVEKYLKPLTDGLIMGVIDEQSTGITVRDEDKEFIARIYSYVFIGIMLDWIKGDMKEDPRLIIDKLALLIKDSVSDALNRFKLRAVFIKMPVLIKMYTIYSAVLKILARRFFCSLKEVENVDIIRTENKFSGGFYVLLSRNL